MEQVKSPFNNSSEINKEGSTSSKPKNYNTLLLILLIVSLIGNIFLFLNRNDLTNKNNFLITENSDLSAAKDTLQNQYDAALARLDDLVGKNAELDQMVKDKDGELAKLKSEIKSLLHKKNATISDLKKAQSLIASLNGKVKTYEERISELETKNTELTETNEELNSENKNITEEAARLKKLGSVLHISNIKIDAINQKHNGEKEVSTSKARKADILRISFDIDENRIVEDGLNEIFLIIEDPTGKLLSNAAYGSGVTTDADDQTINYTVVKRVHLEKNQKMPNISVDWKQDEDFKKGDYNIRFYNAGYKVGGGTVHLK